MNQIKRICAATIAVIMLIGMFAVPAFGNVAISEESEVGFMFDNIFNNGNASVVDSFNLGTWIYAGGVSVTDNGMGVGSAALRFEAGAGSEAVGFISIPLQAGETYNVRVLARNTASDADVGPMRPREGDDAQTNMNKLSFQYDSASEDAAGYTGDRFNMYITSTDWEWVEMTFTTPIDMMPTWAGSPILVFAMRSSTAWIQEIIVENAATGENIFNNGNSIAGEALLDAVWSAPGSITFSNEGTGAPSQAVRIEQGVVAEIEIPLLPNRTYDVRVLARSVNEGSENTFSLSFDGGITSRNILNITASEWRWYRTNLGVTTPAYTAGARITLHAVDSAMYVEAIIILDQNPPPRQATVTINPNVTHQTMEGFGFFGAMNVWWTLPADDPASFYNDEWVDKVLLDLGITMWRNEPFPFINPRSNDLSDVLYSQTQATNWPMQQHVVRALNNRATELNIPFRIILAAWTPPPQWKDNQDVWGGTLLPQYYEAYAHWWVEVLEMYREVGAEVYAISLQNEPFFEQQYNSMQILADEYVELLKVAVPIIRAAFPDVLIYGAESMLYFEHATWAEPIGAWYHHAIVNDPVARYLIDRFAVHGYADGIQPLVIDNHRRLWELERELTGDTPNWMTETSGYGFTWLDAEDGTPGALGLATAIQSALIFGDVAAWVWWQSHNYWSANNEMLWSTYLPDGPHNMKKFAVSRQFYSFIRPYGVRIGTTVTGPETDNDLLVSAFRNQTRLTPTGEINDEHYVVTFVNTSEFDHTVDIAGLGDLTFEMFATTTDAGVDAISLGVVGSHDILIPAQSVVTLVQTDAERGITVLLNGRRLMFDVPPQLIDDRTMVPMRVIFEALGFDVEWYNPERLIIAVGTDVHRTTMTLQAESNIMELETIYLWIGMPDDEPRPDVFSSSREVTLDVPPIIVNDRTLVPLRAIAEATGATVDWDQDTQTVRIVR